MFWKQFQSSVHFFFCIWTDWEQREMLDWVGWTALCKLKIFESWCFIESVLKWIYSFKLLFLKLLWGYLMKMPSNPIYIKMYRLPLETKVVQWLHLCLWLNIKSLKDVGIRWVIESEKLRQSHSGIQYGNKISSVVFSYTHPFFAILW